MYGTSAAMAALSPCTESCCRHIAKHLGVPYGQQAGLQVSFDSPPEVGWQDVKPGLARYVPHVTSAQVAQSAGLYHSCPAG